MTYGTARAAVEEEGFAIYMTARITHSMLALMSALLLLDDKRYCWEGNLAKGSQTAFHAMEADYTHRFPEVCNAVPSHACQVGLHRQDICAW